MKDWKHLTFEQRKVIANGISHNYKLKNISETLGFDPTSVSKEVKRNRVEDSIGLNNNCKRTQRWPFVCSGCKDRYNNCPFTKYRYIASNAQEKADTNLVNSRRGLDVDDDEFKLLVKLQIEKYPEQKKDIIKTQKFLIENIEGIINQRHLLYKCPCSIEGHISNKYAKFITSRPHSYSEESLENIVQLLTMKANNIKLTEEIYHQFKTGESTYKKLNLEKFITTLEINQTKLLIII